MNNGFDHEVAHRAIARIEHAQGWQREDRGLFRVRQDGRVERERPRDERERQPSVRARDFEERVGARSAERIAIEDAAPVIRAAGTWREMHEALGREGNAVREEGLGRDSVGRRPGREGEQRRSRLLNVGAAETLRRVRADAGCRQGDDTASGPRADRAECSWLEAVHRGASPALRRAWGQAGAAAGGGETHGRPASAGAGRHLPRVVEGSWGSPQRGPEQARRPSGAGKGGAA